MNEDYCISMPRRMKYICHTKQACSQLNQNCVEFSSKVPPWSCRQLSLMHHDVKSFQRVTFLWGGCRFLTLTMGLYMPIQLEKRCFRGSGQSKHIICSCIVYLTWWSFKDPYHIRTVHDVGCLAQPQPTDTMVCYITYWRTLWPYPRDWSMSGCFPPILSLVDINPVSWRFE